MELDGIFEKAWAGKPFSYARYITPGSGLVSAHTGRDIPGASRSALPDIQVEGAISIKDALRRVESVPGPEILARKLGYMTPEDAGLNRDEFEEDDWDAWGEEIASAGASEESPEDWLEHSSDLSHNKRAIDRFLEAQIGGGTVSGGSRLPSAEELEMNLERFIGPEHDEKKPEIHTRRWADDWTTEYPTLAREKTLEGLDQARDRGETTTHVSSGHSQAQGYGPMVQVNPMFRGMGYGPATLAALLENTGYAEDNIASRGGQATMQSLHRQLLDRGIDARLDIGDEALTPNSRYTDNPKYRRQGKHQLYIPPDVEHLIGTKGTDTAAGPIGTEGTTYPLPLTISMIAEGEREPWSNERMAELIETARRQARVIGGSETRRGIGGIPVITRPRPGWSDLGYDRPDPEWLRNIEGY